MYLNIHPLAWAVAVQLGHLLAAYDDNPHPMLMIAISELQMQLVAYVNTVFTEESD